MSKRSIAARRRQTNAVSSAAFAGCEPLENRTLLSIAWTNRGTTDNFAVFGANAALARTIVDRAIGDWQRVITNFNYTGGGNTFSLTVTGAMRAAGSRGECSNTIRNNSTQKKPISADVSLDDDGGGGGWYFDPTPGNASFPDDVEFDSLVSPFTGDATGKTGNDFYRTVVHEIGHGMGISDDTTGYLKIGDYLSNGGTDPNGGTLRAVNVNGGAIDYTLTSTGGGHMWEGGNAPGYTGPSHPNDLLNDGRTINLGLTRREIISDADAFLLRDVYGYTINTPSQLNILYVSRNWTTAQIFVRGLNGTNSDTLSIDSYQIVGANYFGITVNGYTLEMAPENVNSFVVNGNGGQDFLRLEGTLGKAVTLSGDAGDDFFDFAFTRHGVGAITGNTYVQGGTGVDQIYVYDNAVTTAQTYTITSSRFDRPGWGGFSYAADVEFENLTTGLGADTVNVQSTFANQPVFLFSASGADTVNIGNSTNGIRSINANVTINNDPSFTTLNINNGPDTGARSWSVDAVGNLGYIIGMAPANIYWDNADIQAINLTCGSGVDTGQFVISTETFNVNNAGANDFITVGVPAAAGLQLITGQLTIDNGPAFTTLTFDDTGSSIPRTVNFDEVGGYNTISGLAPALLRFDSVDTESTKIICGSAVDTINVPRNDDTLIISNSGSGDIVNLGNGTNGLQSIVGSIRVMNPPSFTTLNINDGPNTVARTPFLDNVTIAGALYGEWSQLAPSLIDYKYGDLAAVNITFGSAADVITIRKSQGQLNLTTTGGTDTYTLGGSTDGAQSLFGEITLLNPPSHNSITVSDAANTGGRVATLDDIDIAGAPYGRLTGLSPANINWKYNDTTSVNITLGSGVDSLNVRRHQKPLTIEGTAGTDTVTLGGVAGVGMNGVIAPVTVLNTSGATTLVLDDAADSTANSVNHTMTSPTNGRITGMSPSTIDYKPGEVSSVRLKTGSNGNSVVIAESVTSTRLYYDPASTSDAVAVNPDSVGSAALFSDRKVSMNSLQIGNGGVMTQQAGGANMLITRALSISASGLLDLNDNDMILDYSGAPGPNRAAVQQLINSARAGGAWSGAGITSTSAKNSTPKNKTLGVMEATEYKSVYGANAVFDGTAIDNTAVLVKYTYYGDADFNGVVNFDDYSRTDAGFNLGRSGWLNGDFDGSGNVDFDDYSLIDLAFNTQGSALRPARPSIGGRPVEAVA